MREVVEVVLSLPSCWEGDLAPHCAGGRGGCACNSVLVDGDRSSQPES